MESNNDKIKVDDRVVINTKDRVIFFLCLLLGDIFPQLESARLF